MTTFSLETIEPQSAAGIRAEVPMAELGAVFDRAYPAVMRAVDTQGAAITGPPFGFYPRMPSDTVEVVAGIPVGAPITADGEVEPFTLPGGRAVLATHVGPYEDLDRTYAELLAWASAEGLTLAEGMWESYLSDPGAEPDPSTWRTLIVWPLA